LVYRILGIGDSACETATIFRQEKNYSVDLITDEILGQHANMEEYENKFTSKSVAKIFRKYRKADEVLVIINGASSANGAVLRIAQMIKKCSCSILLLSPSQAWSTPQEITNNRITSGVLQEMTRSGLFDRLYNVSLEEMEKHIDKVPLKEMESEINNKIYSLVSMLIYMDHITPDRTNYQITKQAVRIASLGYFSETGEDHLLYPINQEDIKEIVYYFGIPEEEFTTSVLMDIKNHQANKLAQHPNTYFKAFSMQGDTTVRYSLYLTDIPQSASYL
jgi:hypothetical protein